MGEYEQTLRKKETEDDKIQHRSLAGGMHTDGGSTSLQGKVKRSKAKPDNLIAIAMTVMSRLRFLGILEGSAYLQCTATILTMLTSPLESTSPTGRVATTHTVR